MIKKDYINLIKKITTPRGRFSSVSREIDAFCQSYKQTAIKRIINEVQVTPINSLAGKYPPKKVTAEAYNIIEHLLKTAFNPYKNKTATIDPLAHAVHSGDSNLGELLLKHGASPDGWDELSQIPMLFIAVMQNDLEMVKILINYGANVNIKLKCDERYSNMNNFGLIEYMHEASNNQQYGFQMKFSNYESFTEIAAMVKLLHGRGGLLSSPNNKKSFNHLINSNKNGKYYENWKNLMKKLPA